MILALAPSQEMLLFSQYLGSLENNFLNFITFYYLQVGINYTYMLVYISLYSLYSIHSIYIVYTLCAYIACICMYI